ncbi:MAG: acyl carrier protein [Bacteroidota bacterium]|nr:acyl carrier protein [Bacteroidota bacterium]
MTPNQEEIKSKIRAFITERFLKNAAIGELKDNTPLISGGIMDSISTMQLVTFLEKEFQFEFHPHEVDRDNLDSIERIVGFVNSKKGA